MHDSDRPAGPAIVETLEEAAGLPQPPLLVRRSLEEYLDRHGLGSGALTAQLIGGGHSNVTFRVQREGLRAILRRPPRPPFHPSAHDVMREARVQKALEPTVARVPRVLHACDDTTLLGVPFYLMEEVHGTVITSSLPESLDDAEGRIALTGEFVDALVELHAVDTCAPALRAIDRGPGFIDRQIHRWYAVWQESRTRDIAEIDEVAVWLRRNRPPEPRERTVVHGDYRLGNVMFAAGAPARLQSILDWEIGTVGDPLVDLGWILTTWPEPGDDSGTLLSMAGAVAGGGFPTRAELIDRYATRTGRAVDGLGWYRAFAFWRAAIGLESLYARRVQFSGPNDLFLLSLAIGVPELAVRAREATAEQHRFV
ncbi:MAG: phosphotransferase family protein [Solirubrobacteraceae bacterium]